MIRTGDALAAEDDTAGGGVPVAAGAAGPARGNTANPVRWWQSLRLRIAAAVAAVSMAVLLGVGGVVDTLAARSDRERLRAQALDRLDSAVVFYDATAALRFGATTSPDGLPRPVLDAATLGRRVSWYDGETMFAAQRVSAVEIVSVRLPGTDLDQQRSQLRWAWVQAGSAGSVGAAGLGWLVGTWLSRRLRAGADAARQLAAGRTGVVAAQPGHDEVAHLTDTVDQLAGALQRRLESERRFTADVAHELRSPVTALVSATELLPDDDLGRLQRRQVNRLRRLVEDLLEISRLDSGRVEVAWQTVPLADLVDTAVAPWRDEVSVQTSQPAVVAAEPRRVERILGNLVRNALLHGQTPVTVVARGRCVEIRDSGSGFPEDLLRHGPRRFATYAGSKGSGLGLTIAAQHAAAMGAELAFANAAGGGVVTLTLPDPSLVREGGRPPAGRVDDLSTHTT